MNFARSFKALAGASGTSLHVSHPRLMAMLYVTVAIVGVGIAAYVNGGSVWIVFGVVAVFGVANLWMLVTRGISDER